MLLSSLAAGCGGNPYAVAAAATAVTVAATGVHRATTRDCWARCSIGYACNNETGLCQPGECQPTCPAGYACTVTPTGNSCQPAAAPFVNPLTQQVGVQGATTPQMLPTEPAGPTRAAAELTPDRAHTGQVQIPRGNPGASLPTPPPGAALTTPLAARPAVDADDPCPRPPAPPSGQASDTEKPPERTSSPED